MTYRKTDIEIHSGRFQHGGHPAVNVKVHRFPSTCKIADHFHCEETEAERAGEYAFRSACERFWEEVPDIAHDLFGPSVAVYSEGRSGGWACIDGIDPSIENWTLLTLNKWRSFESRCKKLVSWLASEERVFEDIAVNEWTKPGAEAFNFTELPSGESKCIADLKAAAIAAGFAPIVRK
jgi:hypothetical protein